MPVIINTHQDFSDIKALLGGGDANKNKVNVISVQEQFKRPKTTMISAISKDGFIAKDANDKLRWVPKEDQLWFRKKTIEIGHLIIGKKTFDILPKKALEHRTYWVYTRKIDKGHVAVLDENIYLVNMEPAEFLQYLGKKGTKHVAIVGGKAIYDLFLHSASLGRNNQKTGLIDEIYLSIVNHTLQTGIKFDLDFVQKHFIEVKSKDVADSESRDLGKFEWGERVKYVRK